MKHASNIIKIEQVSDVLFFSFDGTILFRYSKQERTKGWTDWDLSLFSAALGEVREAEFMFENNLLYIIRGRHGFLLVVLTRPAPIALVRLNCSILLPELDREFEMKPRGLSWFSRKKSS